MNYFLVLQIEIVKFLIKYFQAIRELMREDWDNPQNSMLCTTAGIGALIRVMYFLYTKMFVEKFRMDPDDISAVTVTELVTNMKGIGNLDFSKTGEFGGMASHGSLNRLKIRILEEVPYFGIDNFEDDEIRFKECYQKEYKNWLISHKLTAIRK